MVHAANGYTVAGAILAGPTGFDGRKTHCSLHHGQLLDQYDLQGSGGYASVGDLGGDW
jgi:hypothetical protein